MGSCRLKFLKLIGCLNPGLFVLPSPEGSPRSDLMSGDFNDRTPLPDVEAPIGSLTGSNPSGSPVFSSPVQSLILESPIHAAPAVLPSHLRRRNAKSYDEIPAELAAILQRNNCL